MPKIAKGEGLKKVMLSSIEIPPGVSMTLKEYFHAETLISEGKQKRAEPLRGVKRKGTLLLAPLIERGQKGGKEFFVLGAQILALPLTLPTRIIYSIFQYGCKIIKKEAMKEDNRFVKVFKGLVHTLGAELREYKIFILWGQKMRTFGELCSNYYGISISFFQSRLVSIQSNPLLNEIIVTIEEYLEPIPWFCDVLWKGPLVMKSFLFPLTIKGYDRLQAALLRQGILIGTEEVQNLRIKYAKLVEREQKLNYGENQVYLTLKDKCYSGLNSHIQNTSTKICHFSSISIQKTENTSLEENFIFSEWIGEGNERALYINNDSGQDRSGDVCSTNSGGSVFVEYHCHNENNIKFLSKTNEYQYDLEFGTPLACTDKYVKEIEIKRKESGIEVPGSPGSNKRRRIESNGRPEIYSKKRPFNTRSVGAEL